MKSIYVVCGEASGDVHGAKLIQAIKKISPDMRIGAAGGCLVQKETNDGFIETAHLNVTGLTKVLKHIPRYLKLMNQIQEAIERFKPDAVVFIDNPAFNLRLAKKISSLNIPLYYYICPQIWAWGQNRIYTIKRLFKKALVVFEFEEAFYRKHGMSVKWVGHPLADSIAKTPYEFQEAQPKKILLMPGSRGHEVRTLLPIMLKTCEIISKELPKVEFFLMKAPNFDHDFYQTYFNKSGVKIHIVENNKYETMRSADFGLICSGTATLECALCNLPMILLYRDSLLSYIATRILIRVRFIGLPNLLLDEEIIPELYQYNATPSKIAKRSLQLLKDPEALNIMRQNLSRAVENLGESGAADRAAGEILNTKN